MSASLTDWTITRTAPDAFGSPAEMADSGAVWHPIAGPAPIGVLLDDAPWPASSLDDHDWWYSATVESSTDLRLTFGGITFPATVFLDGAAIADVVSMFLPVGVDVPAGSHTLHIRCPALNQWLRKRRGRGRWRSTLVAAQGLRWARTTLLGRAPVYGGGILPAPVGLWRPVDAAGAYARNVRITCADEQIAVSALIHGATAIRCVITDPDGSEILHTTIPLSADGRLTTSVWVPHPRPWWPRGYGDQSLYRVTLIADDVVLADRVAGFRSVTADTSDGGFTLSVNDVDVFARGVTWTPPDPVALTVDTETLAARLLSFADAGATMIRVVGGLTYEQPEFYRLCAEFGLLVWQDVMQATFDPPDDVGEVMCAELTHLLVEQSGNPALAVISGGSETIQQPEMFGVDAGRRHLPLLTDRFPEIVAAQDGPPYVPASPWSPDGTLAIRPDVGVAHWFGVGGYQRRLDDVRTARVRFAAESLAFAIPPSDAAVERDFGSLAVVGHHPDWKAAVPRDRTATWDFEDIRDHYVREVFAVDPLAVRRVDPARYLQLGRLAVAEAMAHCYRFWRQRDSRCAGALILSGIDLLPGAGWGLLTHDGEAKLPLAVLRRLWAPTSVSIVDAGLSGLRIDVHHDGPQPLSATLSLTLAGATDYSESITLQPHSSLTRYDCDLTGEFGDLSASYRFGPPRAEAVQVTLRDDDGRLLARDVVAIAPAPVPIRAGLTGLLRPATDGAWILTVSSVASLRYVCLDVAGWSVDDDCFGLLGAVPHEVTLRPLDAANSPPRVRISSIDALDTGVAQIADGDT
ncbi:hypothetical protein HH308_16895 [Gordonia sp. TBRC 11910]|uniref:beta-mannosidase n=1 Tax=Gordonia asplenii TaxID=2725283 RepID=A0A848KXC3_9ACTN|nr:hypothetical protein [Gordonia asplenii]NMO02892.1 hypothetical protein [Gordonia asplenii]